MALYVVFHNMHQNYSSMDRASRQRMSRSGSFAGTVDPTGADLGQSNQPHNILKKSLHRIDAILAGYNLPDDRMKNRIQKW